MKNSFLLIAMLIAVAGCSQEQEVEVEVEVKEVSASDLAKEMEFTYLKCERDNGYSYDDITQSPDKLISEFKSLYTKEFDKAVARCIQNELNIEDCFGLPTKNSIKAPFSYYCTFPDHSSHENDNYCDEIFKLSFNFLNISNDIPEVEPDNFNDQYKKNKIVFSLANKQFFKAWGYRTPNQIPVEAFSSLDWISYLPTNSGRMWDLNRETLELSVYTTSADFEGYSCEISDKDHYEKADQALDYLVNEFSKVTYQGEGKKEYTDRYNENIKNYKDSIQKEKKEKKEQFEKNMIKNKI